MFHDAIEALKAVGTLVGVFWIGNPVSIDDEFVLISARRQRKIYSPFSRLVWTFQCDYTRPRLLFKAAPDTD